jgi:hypothetical protein
MKAAAMPDDPLAPITRPPIGGVTGDRVCDFMAVTCRLRAAGQLEMRVYAFL